MRQFLGDLARALLVTGVLVTVLAPAAPASGEAPVLSQAKREFVAELKRLSAEIEEASERERSLQARLQQLNAAGTGSSQETATLEEELQIERAKIQSEANEYQQAVQLMNALVEAVGQLTVSIAQPQQQGGARRTVLGRTAAESGQGIPRPPRALVISVHRAGLRRLALYLDGRGPIRRGDDRIRVRVPWRPMATGLHRIRVIGVTSAGRVLTGDLWLLRRDDRIDAIARRALASQP